MEKLLHDAMPGRAKVPVGKQLKPNRLSRWLLFFLFCYSFAFTAQTQCPIADFTATPVNGVCVQDGAVQVAIPGASGCTLTTATIRVAGETTDLNFVNLSGTGTGQFNNLPPGDYEVRVIQGAVTAGPVAVTVTSIYTPLNVTVTGQNLSCSASDPHYSENGEITVSFTGGTGPYTITLTGPGGPYTHSTPTPATYTFTGLAPGNYLATVTDFSAACNSAEARSATIQESSWVPMQLYLIRRMVHNTCEFYLRIEMQYGNVYGTLEQGNATYMVGSDPTVYDLISVSVNPEGAYTFRTEYGLPPDTDVHFTITDGCRTYTTTRNSYDIQDYINVTQMHIITDENCDDAFHMVYWLRNIIGGVRVFYFSPNSTVSYYMEDPVDSNNWVGPVGVQSTSQQWSSSNPLNFTYPNTNTRYRLVIEDDDSCHSFEHIVDARDAIPSNPLDLVQLHEISSILEGTSTIDVRKGSSGWENANGDGIQFPVTISIARTDGQSSLTINPSQPYSLAGAYTINFPYEIIANPPMSIGWYGRRPILGDLPLGEYEVTFTDNCGYSVVRTIDLTNGAAYGPEIDVIQGCLTSDIVYNMNDTNVVNRSFVRLRENNGGVMGAILRDELENPSFTLSGQFLSVLPGEYFIEYGNINYQDRYLINPQNSHTTSNYSIARNLVGTNQSYHVPMLVIPYSVVQFGTLSFFCNSSDTNSGLITVSLTSGTPVGFIRYDIWSPGDNPETDPPLETHTTTDLDEISYVFTGLSAGTYTIRVTNNCGFSQQSVILSGGTIDLPPPIVATPPDVCADDNESILAIALPGTIFDIEWFDQSGNPVGIGSIATVYPAIGNNSYTVEYVLNSALGCSDPLSGTGSVTVNVEERATGLVLVNSCVNGAPVVFTQTGGTPGGEWSVSGGGTIDNNGVFTPGTEAGCFEAIYTSPLGACLQTQSFVVYPSGPLAPEVNAGCGSEVIVTPPADVPDFIIEYSFNGGASWQVDNTVVLADNCGGYDIQVRYVYSGSCTVPLEIPSCTESLPTLRIVDTATPIITTPAQDLMLQCGGFGNTTALNNWLLTRGGAQATDGCSIIGIDNWTNNYDPDDFVTTCGSAGSIEVTFTVTDNCGNERSTIATFSIVDAATPAFVEGLPLDMTVECDAVPDAEELTATDNCGTATVAYEEVRTDGACPNSYTLTRMWTATDECDNETVHVQTITVQDNTSPVFVEALPLDITVECDAVPVAEELTATDNCGTATVAYEEVRTDGACPNSYTLTRMWTATDECDNETVHVQTITVQDNTSPAFVEALPLDITVECDVVPVAEVLTATDNCSDAEVEFEETMAEGNCAGSSVITRTWTATDECGNETVHVQEITVQDTAAPDITACEIQDLTIECAFENNEANAMSWHMDNIEYLLGCATDACSDDLTVTHDYDWANYDEECGNAGTLTVTYQVVDDCGNVSADFVAVLTIVDTAAPDISGCENLDLTIECSFETNEEMANTWHLDNIEYLKGCATDECNDGIEFVINSDFDWANYEETCGNTGTLTVTYQVVDDCGNVSEDFVAVLIIEDTTAPDITACESQDLTIECEASENESMAYQWHLDIIAYLEACATDECNDGYAFTITHDYDWSNYNVVCGTAGTLTVTYQVVDDCGNISANYVTTLTIEDTTAPEIVITDPIFAGVENGDIVEVECYAIDPEWVYPVLRNGGVTVNDDCSDVEFTIEETFVNNGDCKADGFLTQHFYLVTATDDCDNVTTLEFELRVVDRTPPVIVGVPADTTVTCNNIPVPGMGGCHSGGPAEIYVVDECECASLEFEETVSNKSCDYNYDILRRWMATDNCDNVTVAEQRIYVRDQSGPEFIFHEPVLATIPDGSTYYHECVNGEFPEWSRYLNSKIVTAIDGCSGVAEVTFRKDEDRTERYCEDGVIEQWVYEWRATDACGNESVFSFSIAIVDRTGPQFIGDAVVCSADESDHPVAIDMCSEVIYKGYDDRYVKDECGRDIIERTWIAYDVCNNAGVFEQKILLGNRDIVFNVKKGLLPGDFESGDTIAVNCGEEHLMEVFRKPGTVTGSSDCTGSLGLKFNQKVTGNKACEGGYSRIHRYSWSGVDECGEVGDFVVNFGIKDTKPPYFHNNASDLVLNCDDELPAINVADGCSEVTLMLVRQDTLFTSGLCERNVAFTQVYEAIDVCGNKAVFERHISIADESAPVFIAPQYTGCIWEVEAPLVVDGCEGVVERLEYVDSPVLIDACGLYEYIERRWVATDACWNVSELTQTLLVGYNLDAVEVRNPYIGILEQGGSYVIECGDYSGSVTDLFTVSDIVDADCGLLQADVRVTLETSYDCTKSGGLSARYRVTYRLHLPCETVAEYVIYVDVRDTQAPVFVYAPEDRYLGCYDPALFEIPVVEEGCSHYTLQYREQIVEEEHPGGVRIMYVYRTWTARDLCGNTSEHTQVITIHNYENNAEIVLLNTPYCNSGNNKATVEVDHYANDLHFEWKVISGDCIITGGQHTQTITYFIGFSPVRLRVTITDRDGCVIVREITFVCDRINLDGGPRAIAEDFNGEEELLLYPNPTRYNLYLEWEAKREEVVKVRVISVGGVMTKDVLVSQKKGYNKLEIDVHDFTSGVYIIELEEEYQTRHAKFVKIE